MGVRSESDPIHRRAVAGPAKGAGSPRVTGTAGAVFNTSRQLGGALAVAVFGALLATPAGFDSGLRLSLLLAAVIAAAAALTARVGLRT